MRNRSIIPVLALLLLSRLPLAEQTLGGPLIEPVTPSDATTVIGAPAPAGALPASLPPVASTDAAPPSGITEPAPIPEPPPAAVTEPVPPPTTDPSAAPTAKFPPLERQKKEMEQADEGYLIKDAALNDILQYLAKKAGRQYFHNFKISGQEYRVTGHLTEGNPLQQMEEVAFMYGLTLYTKGNTIYALTQTQLNQLPSAEFQYQLRYLRPADMEQIKELIKPLLTPATGVVNFEPKTSTIVIIDSAAKIERVRDLLHSIDVAKGQIIIETKILRIDNTGAHRIGVDWSSSLGSTGVPIEVAKSLNSLFGLTTSIVSSAVSKGQSVTTTETPASTNSVVLSPLQINGVLQALHEHGLSKQVSNPTLITEDNEQATISIIDRVPIITTTVTQTTSSNNVSEEVRYKIDKEDPSIVTAPDKHREIGISIMVSPTLLPDGTIRMKLRPRSAQIVQEIKGQTGNSYPEVNESMLEAISRVPNGHSLVVGGFYSEVMQNNGNQVPFLGRIPVLNFFFKTKQNTSDKTSLVFVVTPTSYNPTSLAANDHHSRRLGNKALNQGNAWSVPQDRRKSREPAILNSDKDSGSTYYPDSGSQSGIGAR